MKKLILAAVAVWGLTACEPIDPINTVGRDLYWTVTPQTSVYDPRTEVIRIDTTQGFEADSTAAFHILFNEMELSPISLDSTQTFLH